MTPPLVHVDRRHVREHYFMEDRGGYHRIEGTVSAVDFGRFIHTGPSERFAQVRVGLNLQLKFQFEGVDLDCFILQYDDLVSVGAIVDDFSIGPFSELDGMGVYVWIDKELGPSSPIGISRRELSFKKIN